MQKLVYAKKRILKSACLYECYVHIFTILLWWRLVKLSAKASFTYDGLGRCFHFVYIYAYTMCPKKSEPLNILQQQQQPQICSDLSKILRTQDDICYKHYFIVSYKCALTLLKYEFFK